MSSYQIDSNTNLECSWHEFGVTKFIFTNAFWLVLGCHVNIYSVRPGWTIRIVNRQLTDNILLRGRSVVPLHDIPKPIIQRTAAKLTQTKREEIVHNRLATPIISLTILSYSWWKIFSSTSFVHLEPQFVQARRVGPLHHSQSFNCHSNLVEPSWRNISYTVLRQAQPQLRDVPYNSGVPLLLQRQLKGLCSAWSKTGQICLSGNNLFARDSVITVRPYDSHCLCEDVLDTLFLAARDTVRLIEDNLGISNLNVVWDTWNLDWSFGEGFNLLSGRR